MQVTGVHGGGTSPAIVRRVYYIGTDTLREGYALCYNFDVADETAEALTLSLAESLVETPARRLQVEKPTWKNSFHFAGVVSDKSNGVTGPGWVEINCPGSICNIYTFINCDHEHANLNSGANVASGQIINFTAEQYYFAFSGFVGSGSAIVLRDIDRSSTAGLVMAELVTGPPSGGVQSIQSVHMADAGAVCLGGSILFAPWGMTVNGKTLSGQDAAFTAAGSTLGLGANMGGTYVSPGTLKGFRTVVSQSGTWETFDIGVSLGTRSCITSIAGGAMNSLLVDGTFNVGSLIGEGGTWRWSGNAWVNSERFGWETHFTT